MAQQTEIRLVIAIVDAKASRIFVLNTGQYEKMRLLKTRNRTIILGSAKRVVRSLELNEVIKTSADDIRILDQFTEQQPNIGGVERCFVVCDAQVLSTRQLLELKGNPERRIVPGSVQHLYEQLRATLAAEYEFEQQAA